MFTEWKAKRTIRHDFCVFHLPWKWTTIRYHSLSVSVSFFYISVYVFIFRSYKYSVSFEHFLFFFYRSFFDSYSQRERISFLFSIYSPKQQYPWSSWFCNWMAKALCHRVSIHFLSLCVLPAVFVHGEISWILNCIMEHAPPFHYATPSIRLSFFTKNKKKRHRLKWVAT